MTWMTAAQALAVLDVLPQTLYANVSRGKIRARPDRSDPRRSLYHRGDVLEMARRAKGRRKVEAVAAQAIEWGDPVLPSAISTVIDGRLWYRGQDAVQLAETATFEEVAGLLWGAAEPAPSPAPSARAPSRTGDPLRDGLLALAARSVDDLPSQGRSADVLRRDAASVMETLAAAMLGDGAPGPGRPLSARLACAWRRPGLEDTIRRVLVLLADHELNASTFATRVAISTGASLSAGVLSGLATLTGPMHGGASASVRALATLAARHGVQRAVRDWLTQGQLFAAFGHPLYPDGDVRAAALLANQPPLPLYAELAACVESATGERPNVDFALASLAASKRLPRSAPFTLFALARCAGWLAHAIEQAQTGHLIRPRARYVGPPVGPPPAAAEAPRRPGALRRAQS